MVLNIAPYPPLERNPMGQKCYVLPEKLAGCRELENWKEKKGKGKENPPGTGLGAI